MSKYKCHVCKQVFDSPDADHRIARIEMDPHIGLGPRMWFCPTVAENMMAAKRTLEKTDALYPLTEISDPIRPEDIPPVDRSKRETIGGTPIGEHLEIKPGGQQKDYIVLSDEERSRGFVRPVRNTYRHLKCGASTTMGQKLAETYSRDPGFYSGTFCANCGAHFPVGENGEFVWEGSDEKVGT